MNKIEIDVPDNITNNEMLRIVLEKVFPTDCDKLFDNTEYSGWLNEPYKYKSK